MDITRIRLSKCFKKLFENQYISILTGPRQIGKTTFINQFINNLKITEDCLLKLNFDSFDLREDIRTNGLMNKIESHFKEKIVNFKKQKIIFIDEVQKVPEVFEQIKIIYDDYKHDQKIKIILSGSSALDIHAHSSESLAGRISRIYGFNFDLLEACLIQNIKPYSDNYLRVFDPGSSFEELLEIKQQAISSQDDKLNRLLRNLICFGSMPDIVKFYDDNLTKIDAIYLYLKNYRETYLDKDIRSLDQVGNLNAFNKLLEALAAQVGGLLNKSNLCSDLGMNFNTVQSYMSILEETFIIDLIKPYSKGIKKRIIKSPKIYFFDNGLISMILGIKSFEQLKKLKLLGCFFENFVLNEIKKILVNKDPWLNIYFHRTSNDSEVDLILDYGSKIIPIEIKYSASKNNLKLSYLKNFIKEQQCDYGLVIYNGEYDYDIEHRIIYFPVQYFAC